MLDLVNRMLAPLRTRLANMVGRAIVQLANDATKLQGLQLTVLDSEVRDGCERVQQYGFTAVPLAGAEAVVLFVGGFRDHPVVIAVDDRRYRKAGLQPGEVAVYTDEGKYLLFKRGGVVELQAVALDNLGVYKVDGVQVLGNQGAAVADVAAGGTTDANARATINLLLARCRAHGIIAT